MSCTLLPQLSLSSITIEDKKKKQKENARKENARKREMVRENKDGKAILRENSEANLDQRKKLSTHPIEHVSRKSFQPIST